MSDQSKPIHVILETNLGKIHLALDKDTAPKTVTNFLNYVNSGFYDGTIFHRVINGFMIQGGGFTSGLQAKQGNSPIENEAEHAKPNRRGTIAMARTSEPHSATSQFFINVTDNNFLNHSQKTADGWGYCVFGKVVSGMNVVDQIRAVDTKTQGSYQDVPIKEVIIKKAYVESE